MRGTKRERAPGVWQLRVYIGEDPATGNPRQVARTFRGTKRQADTALAELVRDFNKGALSTGTSTLAEYLHGWIDHVAPSKSPTTARGYRGLVKRIDDKLGRIKLAKLTAQHLDRAYQQWLDEGLHPSTVHHLHGVLSSALNQAVKWGLVDAAATAKASPPPLRTRPKQVPSRDVIHRLIAAAEKRGQPVLAAAIAIATTTGARRGELLGLRWTDIDLERAVLTIERSIKHADGPGWVIGPTKTHAHRRVALDPFSVEALSRLRLDSVQRAEDALVDLDPGGFVFTFDPTGTTPMRPDSLGQAFGRLCAREGIEGVSLHTLRHFSASVLVASGRDVRTIAGRLGHADATTTLRVYSHMIEGRDRDAADFLGRLMAGRAAGAAPGAALDEGRPVDPV